MLGDAIVNFTLAGQNVFELMSDGSSTSQLASPAPYWAMASTLCVVALMAFAGPRRQFLART